MPRPLAVLLLCTVCVTTLGADDAEKPEGPLVRRIYDVTDLVHAPAFDAGDSAIVPPTGMTAGRRPNYGGGGNLMGNNGGGRAEVETTEKRLERLVVLLEQSIDPTVWRSAGGSESSLVTYGTRLVVIARPQTHARLLQMIDEIRSFEARPVRVRATWAALSDEELAGVIVPPAKDDKAGARGPRVIDLAAVDRLSGAVRHRAELNALSGHRASATAGRVRSVLTSVDAVVGNGSAAFEPSVELVLAGATLDVIPMLAEDGATATLDVRSVVGRWDAPDAPPIRLPPPVATTRPTITTGATPAAGPNSSPGIPVELDRLNMPVHHLTATTKVPTGRAVLIGGLTGAGAAQKDDPRPLYLILETHGAAVSAKP